jgi:hypothetical protein
MTPERTRGQAGYPAVLADQANEFLTQVYGWMCAGLGLDEILETTWAELITTQRQQLELLTEFASRGTKSPTIQP